MRTHVGRVAVVCGCVGVSVWLWRGVPARGAENAAQAGTAVRLVPAGERLGGNPGEKGATYYALEARTRRLTTRFAHAVAVAETGLDGDVNAVVRDANGRELGRLLVNHLDAARDVVQFTGDSGSRFQAFGEPGVKMTMDWANRQAYSLTTDGVDAADPVVEWRAGFIRRRGTPHRDLEREIVQLQTEWDEGLTAVTSRRPAAVRRGLGGREFTGEVVITELLKDGQRVGVTNWFPREQVFTWSLPGMTKGSITPKELAQYGGWPFTPDLEWMNLQAIAFHHFKTAIDTQRFVARNRPGWIANVLQYVMPVVEANEPGCDDLHWLDGTLYRYCCDIHDACYSTFGCTSRSWWQFWTGWRCQQCNAWVIDCFEAVSDTIFLSMQ